MGVAAGPNTVEDGLVFALDAGNPKNYNVGISTNWTDKVGGNNGTLVNETYHNDGPFVGAGYVEFDGTGDYLTTATHASDFNFGTGDFTIEFWINSTQTSRADPFAWNFDYNTTGWGSFILNVSSGRIDWYEGLGIATYATSTGWNDGLWHHLAVSRSGTSLKMFLDGVQIGSTASSSYSYGASDVGVSVGFSTSTGYYLNGQMSNVRIVKGTALYTSNFTPPTKPLTDISGTKLLTCQGNTITDASVGIHTITANGDISLTKEPFGGAGAVKFDGTGDYLSFTKNTTTGSFTCECWFYRGADVSNYHIIFSGDNLGSVNANNVQLQVSNTGAVGWYQGASVISQTGTAVQQNAWNHIAWVRSGTSCAIFVNGSRIATGTNSNALNVTQISTYLSGGYQLNGYISNARIVDAAVYDPAQTTISVPTKPLEPIENTFLLTCQGQNIKDASSNAHTITPNGDAKATIVSSSFEFDGSDDYIDVGSTNIPAGPLTVSAWVNVASDVSIATIAASNGDWIFGTTSRKPFAYNYASTAQATSPSGHALSIGVWYNVVMVQGSSLDVYINGSLSVTNSDGTDMTATEDLDIGRRAGNNDRYHHGKIADLKIYSRALTAAEVTQNYNATKGRYGL